MRLRMTSPALLALCGLHAVSLSAQAAVHRWQTYANVRYGYQICYPADRLSARPDAPNGDGRVFDGGGAKLSVWGSYVIDDTLATHLQRTRSSLAAKGGTIAYQAVKPDWYVVSARQGDQIVYQRTRRVGDMFQTFSMRYPASEGHAWDAIVAHVGGCFRSLDAPRYGAATLNLSGPHHRAASYW